jgi:tetratricopeptide (TPR) repeat protein
LARLCGGLPLALRIAGARLAARPAWPLHALVDRLTDQHHRLDELQVSDLAVRASFQVGYDALRAGSGSPQAGDATLFRLLGLMDGPDVAAATAGALLECPTAEAEAALERLVDAHLLECPGPGRYRMHDLLRLFARERCVAEEPGPARAAALRRVLRRYVVTARRACALLYPGDGWRAAGGPDDGNLGVPLADKAAAMAWLEAERANLLAAARQASDGPEPVAATVGPLAMALYRFLEFGGYWHDLREFNQLALRAARRVGDRRGEAQALSDLATADRWLRQPDEAIAGHERSLEIWRQLGDRVGEGHALGNLGVQYHELGRVDTAVAYHTRSLKIFREVGDRGAEGRALCNIGVGHEDRGRYDQAVACYEQALAIARQLDDLGAQGYALTNLGDAHRLAGRPATAATWYERSLSVHREVGDHYLEGEALCHLGEALHTLGKCEQARARWREALDVFVALRLAAKADEVRALLAEAGQPAPAATAPRPG